MEEHKLELEQLITRVRSTALTRLELEQVHGRAAVIRTGVNAFETQVKVLAEVYSRMYKGDKARS